jgi:hypothetical protein
MKHRFGIFLRLVLCGVPGVLALGPRAFAQTPVPRTGQCEIVAERMTIGGAPSHLGGGVERLKLCATEDGSRIFVNMLDLGDLVFELDPGPEDRHLAKILPDSFQGVIWVLEVVSETELTSIIMGEGVGATHLQQHVWRFLDEDPSVNYCGSNIISP